MPMMVPLFPYKLGGNKCYRFIQDEYKKHKETDWSEAYLVENFGGSYVSEIIESGYFLPIRGEKLRVAFAEYDTPTEKIINIVSKEPNLFLELLEKLGTKSRYTKQKLKHCLAFLSNFEQIQYFELPMSSLLLITADHHPERDLDIDCIYSKPAPFMEPEYVYKIDADDNLKQLSELNPF